MRDFFDFVGRIVIYVGTLCVTFALFSVFAFFMIIATRGTGPLTSHPPPEHIAWLPILIGLIIWSALQWGILRLHRLLISALDRFALRQ
jgi:hypothetical protein